MAFGITGSHRSGKSTLAKDIAASLHIPYHDASVTKVMQEAGVNAVGNLSLEERMNAQEFMLDKTIEILAKVPRPFITDRTPIDMIGYTMGELTMHNSSIEMGNRIADYAKRCIKATEDNFAMVFVLEPLPVFAVDPNKPPPNLGYQQMVQYIMEGAALNVRASTKIRFVSTADHAERMAIVEHNISGMFASELLEAKAASLH